MEHESDWGTVLSGHRSSVEIDRLGALFEAQGVVPDVVASALEDPEGFAADAVDGGPGWVHGWGVQLGATLVAAEILERSAAVQRAVSNVRSRLVAQILEDEGSSVVDVARQLGYSHQHVSRLRRSGALVPAGRGVVRECL